MWTLSLTALLLLSTSLNAKNCIAHRGDNQNHLENSIASFNAAMDLNAHGIEFDLQHTKDGFAIIMHDKTLKRTAKSKENQSCPLKTKIKKLTLNQIKENCLLNDGSPILDLEEALILFENFPGHLFIELKDSPSSHTLATIAQYRSGKEKTTRFISFKKRYLKKARKLKHKYPLYAEIDMLNINVFIPFAGRGIGVDISKFGGRFLFWARWWKKEIGVWTVDKISKMRKLFKKKVPFITTNNITGCMELSRDYN